MCGICGFVGSAFKGVLERMVAKLRHRGPDELGLHHDSRVGLGIARLSIIDVQSGHQPYYNEDRSIVAVFNGELYNYRELTAWLTSRGHRLNSGADGEVLVHLYEEFGEDFVDHLNGMFGIAIWNGEELLLARDRLGIKPMYYAEKGGVFYFASEIKAMLEQLDPALDPQALDDYLTYDAVPAPGSIFAGVKKLPAGCIWRSGKVRRYWKARRVQGAPRSQAEWLDELEYRLRQAVSRQLISDVPLGLFLSGGLDSSTLTYLAGPGMKTFSIGFEQPTFDESAWSSEVARHLQTQHHVEIMRAEDVTQLLDQILNVLDEPLADPAMLPTLMLSRLARRHVTVALAGEGADEIFGGYPTYLAHRLAEPLERLPAVAVQALRAGVNRLPVSHRYLSFDYKAKRFVRFLGEPAARRHQLWMAPFSSEERRRLYHPDFALQLGCYDSLARVPDAEPQILDIEFYLAENLLVKLDRASMAVSLEGRVPYLDHHLVEFVLSMPPRPNKGWLRALARRWLPPGAWKRAKKGFGLPLGLWFQGPLREPLRAALETLESLPFFDKQQLRLLWNEHEQGRVDRRKELWSLLVLEGWWRRWMNVVSRQCKEIADVRRFREKSF